MSTRIRQGMLAIVTAFLPCAPAFAAPVDVELRPQVVARDRHVVLGDVAFLRSADLASMQRLVSLPLGQAPGVGRDAVLDRAVLQRWIRLRLGFAAGELRWAGAEYAVVRGTGDQGVRATQSAQPVVPARSAAVAAPAAPAAATSVTAPATPSPGALVARGDWVTLRMLSGQVQLEARAEALQAGEAGEVVRVRMPGATQPIDARVLARGSVEAMP